MSLKLLPQINIQPKESMPTPKKELIKRKNKRMDLMIKEAGLEMGFKAFATKLLRNWEDKKSDDPTNALFKKLVNNFK